MINYSFSDAGNKLNLTPWELAGGCITKKIPYNINHNRVMIPLEDRLEINVEHSEVQKEEARSLIATPTTTPPTTTRPTNPFETLSTTTPPAQYKPKNPAKVPAQVRPPLSAYPEQKASQHASDTKKYTCLDDALRTQLTSAGWDADAVDAIYRGFSTKRFTQPANYEQHIRGKIQTRYNGKSDIDKVFKNLVKTGAIVQSPGKGAYRLNQLWNQITDPAVKEYAQRFKRSEN